VPAIPDKRKITITLPVALLSRIVEVAGDRRISRSELIRLAVQHHLEAQKEAELSELLKEGYLSRAEESLQIAEEFAHAEHEATMTTEWREENSG